MIRGKLRNNRQWRAATSLTEKQFDQLIPAFAIAYEELNGKTLEQKVADSPKEPYLKTYDSLLLLVLFSMKTGVTFDVLGVVFDMDGSSAQRNQEKGLCVLQTALNNLGVLPTRQFDTVKEFEMYMQSHEKLLIDATEIRAQRPSNNEDQKDMYSGKKNVIL